MRKHKMETNGERERGTTLRKKEGRTRWSASSVRSSLAERIPVRTPPQRTIIASTTITIRKQRPPDYGDSNEHTAMEINKHMVLRQPRESLERSTHPIQHPTVTKPGQAALAQRSE